jgi:predicted aldo/keto reductase-like oxidoreductase
MKNNPNPMSRRKFLAVTGAVGLGSMLAPTGLLAATSLPPKVARKPFGKTGVEVSALGLGCMFDIIDNQIILQRAFDHGVNYWDTAAVYEKGGSERGIGMFLEKNPSARNELFITTKGKISELPQTLDESLARLKTDHVDLFLLHGVSSIDEVDRLKIRAFAERAKQEGKIRFIGFSTHSNMAECLMAAPRLGWIDAILFTYNYRIMHEPDLVLAMEACDRAGIALIAMKTQGQRQREDTSEQQALLTPFAARGFTPGQAKLKVAMEHPHISTAIVQMPNLRLCRENIAAALDQTRLADYDYALLERYAAATAGTYCAGCRRHCEQALGGTVPVQDVMRQLMYHRNYGGEVDARALFADLPARVREQLPLLDYQGAERACPRHLPVGQLMREASGLLA